MAHPHDAAVAAAVDVARRGRSAVGPETTGHLARRLYAEWYAASPADAVGDVDGDVTEALRAACAGAGSFQGGWRAERVSSAGRVLAVRRGERRLLHPLDYVCPQRPGLPPRVRGGDLLVVDRRDTPEPVDGYWSVFGRLWPMDGDAGPLVRVYWNVSARDGPCLVDMLTRSLAGASAAWALKLPADAADYRRPDAAVLYVSDVGLDAVVPCVYAAAAALADRLGATVPPLTRQIAPGVASADDPDGDESFGMHRCRLIAEALTACDDGDGGAVAAVWRRFAREGIDRRRPHLGSGVTGDRWHRGEPRPAPVPVRAGATVWPSRSALPNEGDAGDRARFVAAAAAVGGRLVEEAVWHEDRCTWVGDALEPVGGHWRVVLRACAGDLYGGTSGIALFLARAAGPCGDAAMARAAAAGAHSALRWVERTAVPAGLHDGAPGAVWAALEVAGLLRDGALRRRAVAAADVVCTAVAAAPAVAPDIVAGDAGSILACRGIDRVMRHADGGVEGFAPARAAASAAGRRLMAGARRTPEGWWWPVDGGESAGLCGMAHGAAGIAVALAVLAEWTGDAAPGNAAREGVRWERARFSREAGGWPDLRVEAGAGATYPAMWCHGAIGIGMARLALHARDRECASLAEAGAAIQLTRAMLAAGPDRPPDWSLCHGASGAIELFLRAHEVTGCADHLAAAVRLADAAVESGAGGDGTWSCGVPGGGECAGLMLGLAGIGMTLLRVGGAVTAQEYLGTR